jgi:integrase
MITATPIKMTGIFAELADSFIEFKRAQGYKYYSEAKVLSRFCRFAESYPLKKPALTKELIADWTSPREDEAKKSRMHRITCVNQFGNYLKQMGCEVCAIPPQSHWNIGSFTPYIFTHEEIGKLLRASDNVRPIPQSRNIHKSLPVLLRLLYGCGLRISEAVGLRCRDVDLERGILTVREAKNGRDRLIPLSLSLKELLREYKNDVIPWANDDDFFFMAPDRSILSPNTVYGRFRRILWEGGIPYGGKGNGPRLHDLRHTFAVHTLQKWVQNGEDLTAMLPVLSVFMGHKSFSATSRYLRLTAEVYPDVVKQVEQTCAYAIPGGDSL